MGLIVGVPTREFLLAKLEFCDRGRSAVVFSATHPSTRNLGGAREFHGRIVVAPTEILQKKNPKTKIKKPAFAGGLSFTEQDSAF
ncbi:hypothetical protein JWG45_09505 [Leptospira sp. 201903070]|uniref:Uncharacterized protein n=1 Tax=Leptospira ainlahdjerensis TaxID=2810033 RepID=A0ABS2UCV8_9LEPT|nr:hypothetical protein [Leptospira ainlahdjerensis]MBM9577388.1 hypothetical protein [Leptospira ainlahdjerensis]